MPKRRSRRRESMTSCRPVCWAMIEAVSMARARSLAYRAEKASPASRRPTACAWDRPTSDSGVSVVPCMRFSRFHTVSPWRTTINVVSLIDSHWSRISQELSDAGDALLQPVDRIGVGKTDVPLRRVRPEIDARSDRHAGALQQVAREAVAVPGQFSAPRIDIEGALRHHRDIEAEPPQRRHQVVAPRLELVPALL